VNDAQVPKDGLSISHLDALLKAPIETQMRDAVGRLRPHRSKDDLLLDGALEIERLREYEWKYKELCK
jgi:hypothetical protein